MFRRTMVAVVATVSISATPVAAATIADVYSSFWVFGDSLSDNGNLFAASGGFPPDPYFEGRFSDGPVWNERFLADFGPGEAANFAFGAARAVPNDDGIPDLPDQIAVFESVRPFLSLGDRSLASVFFGANDMFAAISSAASAALTDPGSIPGIIGGSVSATVGAISTGVADLAALGIHEFALWNLPDLGSTPRLQDLGDGVAGLGTRVTLAYNAAFDAMVADLRAAGLVIHTVDTFGLFTAATADPDAFGLTNLTDACFAVDPFDLLAPGFEPPAVCGTPGSFLYWDKLHPTRTGHDALAAAFDASVPAIPLPASALFLLAGLGGLAAVRRRAA